MAGPAVARHLYDEPHARRARMPEDITWRPKDDVAAVKGCLSGLGILGGAILLGVLVTWLLIRWG